ncbi:GNAT family N-acetyltransferase [Halobacillus sp. Nhm2S1]|uniref:GNAT family N-acetyltransferase n=1 Tax=Halobacillus sp. Nhm2S1 TaxID=2866716 RepID=UPI001C73A5AB|nr:GNAT family N-acetyltransferase [Halobacillus sp. Nhm2S1]MBX0358416.1 GNAT family N-acetyltransferase [Halobacillus sp. Nhm2S1]
MNIRKAEPEDVPAIARVHVDAWLETYRGLVPDTYLDRLTYEKRESLWEENIQSSEIILVENDEGVVGFATWNYSSTYGNYDAELSSIYILQRFQRRGAGKALFSFILNDVKEKGSQTMMVKVLSDNPSCQFYEGMGGKKVEEVTITIDGNSLVESIYSWTLDEMSAEF